MLYKLNKNIELLKDDSIILALTSSDPDKQISITILEDSFHTEDDKNRWIEYVLNHDLISDKLRSMLYILSVSPMVLYSVQNRKSFIHHISSVLDDIVRLINIYIDNKDNQDLFAILSEIDNDAILNSLSKIDEDKFVQYLLSLPLNKAVEFISDSRCAKYSIKNKLLATKYGCTILTEDLYLRKSEIVDEWDVVLSAIGRIETSFFF